MLGLPLPILKRKPSFMKLRNFIIEFEVGGPLIFFARKISDP